MKCDLSTSSNSDVVLGWVSGGSLKPPTDRHTQTLGRRCRDDFERAGVAEHAIRFVWTAFGIRAHAGLAVPERGWSVFLVETH